jgi:hypothetical protein
MTDTKDFRWFAADTVMRKSLSAMQALLRQQELIAARTQGEGGQDVGPPPDDALVVETQRAIDMAREALAELPNEEQKGEETTWLE